MLSYLVGRPVVYKYLTEKAVKWSEQVKFLHRLSLLIKNVWNRMEDKRYCAHTPTRNGF